MRGFIIKQKIVSIAKNVLEESELSAVLDIIKAYKTKTATGIKAFFAFDKMFYVPTKDPMFSQQKGGWVDIFSMTPVEESWGYLHNALIYCRYFVTNTDLNETSRDFIRRSCDYVENCAKYLLSSLELNTSLRYPLGNIINALKRRDLNIPTDLLEQVEIFNKEIYTEAKHKHNLPPGQHLYTPDEAFLIYFVAKKLGCKMRELVKLSN